MYEAIKPGAKDLYERAKYQVILDWLRPYGPMNILNAGFGSGILSFLLAADGHRVTGIDISHECYSLILQRVRELEDEGPYEWLSRCSFHLTPIEKFSPPAPYDCVVSTDVIEHIEDDDRAIARLCGFVAPGGVLVITVPAGPWLFGYHDELIGHCRRYTIRSLRKKLEGLVTLRKMKYFGFSMIPACLLYSRILRREYPLADTGSRESKPLLSSSVSLLLELDRRLPLPFGTGILCLAERPPLAR